MMILQLLIMEPTKTVHYSESMYQNVSNSCTELEMMFWRGRKFAFVLLLARFTRVDR